MMAHYLATNDRRILTALKRHYLSDSCDHSLGRDVCNVEIMLWLYEKTQDKRLLTRALDAFEKYNRATAHAGNAQPGQLPGGIDTTIAGMLSAKPGQSHGVTYNEIAKLAAIIYIYTGKKKYLAATVNAYRKIDKFHMLIDGVCSSSEQLRGHTALDSHETCDIADYTWSLGYLLMATGQAQYADKIERAIKKVSGEALTEIVFSMADAVNAAQKLVRRGDKVILSPACASYDMFDNYQQRGEIVRDLVLSLQR